MNFLVKIVKGTASFIVALLLVSAVIGTVLMVTVAAPVLGVIVIVGVIAVGLYLEIPERDP